LASDEFTNLIALVFANRVTPADTVDEMPWSSSHR
jgi:hypothetical protein